jgi:cytochrome P450
VPSSTKAFLSTVGSWEEASALLQGHCSSKTSSVSYFTHYNETVFSQPREYIPERWLEEKEGRSLQSYIVNFGKGARSCIGKNLAISMVYLTIATVFWRLDMVPFETEDRDVDLERDWLVP